MLYAKNGSKVNIAGIIDKGLDKAYLEKKVGLKIRSGIFSSLSEGSPVPAKYNDRIKRCEKITTYGEGDLKEFYKTYTTNINDAAMPKYKLGSFSGADYKWDKHD